MINAVFFGLLSQKDIAPDMEWIAYVAFVIVVTLVQGATLYWGISIVIRNNPYLIAYFGKEWGFTMSDCYIRATELYQTTFFVSCVNFLMFLATFYTLYMRFVPSLVSQMRD